ISLPVTPSALWAAPLAARLFAVLPGTGQVAVLDVSRRSGARFVSVGGRPVAIAGGGARAVVVVDGSSGRVTRLDARTGARLGSPVAPSLASPPSRPPALRGAPSTTAGERQTITLALGGGLDAHALSTQDVQIRDGRAVIELWQSGVTSTFASRTLGGVTIR